MTNLLKRLQEANIFQPPKGGDSRMETPDVEPGEYELLFGSNFHCYLMQGYTTKANLGTEDQEYIVAKRLKDLAVEPLIPLDQMKRLVRKRYKDASLEQQMIDYVRLKPLSVKVGGKVSTGAV